MGRKLGSMPSFTASQHAKAAGTGLQAYYQAGQATQPKQTALTGESDGGNHPPEGGEEGQGRKDWGHKVVRALAQRGHGARDEEEGEKQAKPGCDISKTAGER